MAEADSVRGDRGRVYGADQSGAVPARYLTDRPCDLL